MKRPPSVTIVALLLGLMGLWCLLTVVKLFADRQFVHLLTSYNVWVLIAFLIMLPMPSILLVSSGAMFAGGARGRTLYLFSMPACLLICYIPPFVLPFGVWVGFGEEVPLNIILYVFAVIVLTRPAAKVYFKSQVPAETVSPESTPEIGGHP